MKNVILIFFAVVFSSILKAQTNFVRGFNVGYKKGYCYEQGIGCIEPIAPIAPIPRIGESSESYEDGYNRGFSMGKEAKLKQSNTNQPDTHYKTPDRNYVDDFVYNPYQNENTSNPTTPLARQKLQQVDHLFKKALESYQNDDCEAAIYYTSEIMKIEPNLAVVHELKAMSHSCLGDYLNAFNIISKAQKFDNSSKENFEHVLLSVYFYFELEMSRSNYQSIILFCENVWSHHTLTYYFGGMAYYYINNYERAKDYFTKIDSEKRFLNTANYLEAIKNKTIIPNPYIKVELFSSSYIKKLLETKQYSAVIEQLEPIALKIIKDNIVDKKVLFEVYYSLCYAYYNTKNLEKCIEYATLSINNSQSKEIGHLYYIRAYSKSLIGDYYGSINDYDYLIDHFEDINYKEMSKATLLNNKAYNLVFLKKFLEAKAIIDVAIMMDKTKYFIWDTKGEIEYNLGNYIECVKAMTVALSLKETDNSYFYRGLSKIKLGNIAEGCSDLSKAGELGSKEAYIQINKNCK